MSHKITSADDTVEIYPSKKLMDNWKNGVSIEEVREQIRTSSELDETTKRFAIYIAEQFYEKWDADGFIRVQVEIGG